ncbi:MAG TPA: TenA family protein [Bacteroidales bacterium]|nr:TenA family protein [Bacteroidales bacterium]
MKPAGPFTRKLLMTVQPVYEQIINCLFVRRLTDGTLLHKWFAHYLSQDVLYIIDYSRALAVTAARAKNPDEVYFFLQMAKDGLDIERALHDDFIRQFNISGTVKKSPAFNAYADFLLNNAFNSPYPVAVAALLPCFWVYYKTGEYVFKNTIDNNPYRKWIETYSGDEYMQYTKRFIHITENLGQKADPVIREQMVSAFTECAKHELRVFEESSKQ